jgi:hypothetical protein
MVLAIDSKTQDKVPITICETIGKSGILSTEIELYHEGRIIPL